MRAAEQVEITPEIVRQHGLSEEEHALIVEAMGREPNLVELGLFSVMWSEHCAYKNSRPLLKRLPTTGARVVQGPGENAGVVALNEEWAVCFKIESHNHPSAVEPYQGAATGVGGILRDIFTMGARPVALLNSLRFGNPKEKRPRFLLEGVVAGIADYGNCVGVPTVGGEIEFGDGWAENILVNVMAVGIVRRDRVVRGRAEGEGNLVVYFGNATGRDGIHGATFASEELSENSKARRPCVQVADPFMEKKILEATLELVERGLVVGVQDMGAAGLTCSSSEMAARARTGMELDLDAVPQRAEEMSAYEIMLSESQERMLAVVRPKDLGAAREVLERWEVGCHLVGKVAGDGMLRVRHRGEVAGEVPLRALCEEAPTYRRSGEQTQSTQRGPSRKELPKLSVEEGLLRLLAQTTIASKRWVYRQFDHQVQLNTVLRPGADAAVLRVKETGQLIALTVDGCSRKSGDGKLCGALAVAEAARNLSAVGAEPIGVTNCLNFGNPNDPQIYAQLAGAIEGIAEACEALGVPVTGGNVSLYNEGGRGAVPPTPVIGMVGLIEKASHVMTPGWKKAGDIIFIVGHGDAGTGGRGGGAQPRAAVPHLDLEFERKVQEAVRGAIQVGLVQSCHDVSAGGLAVALAEGCLLSADGLGAALDALSEKIEEAEAELFSEQPSRFVVSVKREIAEAFEKFFLERAVPVWRLGEVAATGALEWESGPRIGLVDLRRAHETLPWE